MIKILLIVLIAVLSIALFLFLPVEKNISKGLSILVFIGLLWITESLSLTVTALLVPILAVFTGIFNVETALSHFANPVIFLFLGGFALAAALRKHKLDKFLIDIVMRAGGNRKTVSVLLLFLLTAAISMWISNTATVAMMLPLGIGLIGSIEDKSDTATKAFILLGIAYSANIGGIGTIVGSPPNAITAANLGFTFSQWLKVGIPSVIVLFPIMVFILYLLFKPKLSDLNYESQPGAFYKRILNKDSILVGVIFFITVLLWLFSKPLSSMLGILKGFDAIVALIAIFLLVVSRVVEWKEIERHTDWGVLILFGGGLTLSAVLSETGSSKFLADKANDIFAVYGPIILIGACVLLTIFLTEVASNTASAAIIVPIFYALSAETAFLTPNELPLAAGIAASCAFMLPVATPPNALVYGTGEIKQRTMMSVGFRLNIVFTVVITLLAYLIF